MIDDGRFPKDRSFPRNQPGRAALDIIGANDSLTWLRKRRFLAGSGLAEARNKGGYLTVKAGAPVLPDGFYSLGVLVGETVQKIFGDGDLRGAFSERGTFLPVDDGGAANSSNAMSYLGKGLGWAIEYDAQPVSTGPQGENVPWWKVTAWMTRDGRTKTTLFENVNFVQPNTSNDVIPIYAPSVGSVAPSRVSGEWSYAFLTLTVLDSDEFFFVGLRPVPESPGSLWLLALPTVADQLPYDFLPMRMSPQSIMGYSRYFRGQFPAGTPNMPDNASCPGGLVLFSNDNGAAWAPASSTEFFNEFEDTVHSLPYDNGSGGQNTSPNSVFNYAVAWMTVAAAPISSTKAIGFGMVPYTDDPGITIPSNLKAKVKLGLIDFAAGTFLSTLTLKDDTLQTCEYYSHRKQIVPVDGGVVFLIYPEATNSNDHPQPCFTPDGVSVVYQPAMPQTARNTGVLFSISPTEIGLPIYDAEQGHIVLSSKDRGATWKQRALITNKGKPPAGAGDMGFHNLDNFSTVVQLLDNGGAANSMPGARWAGDSSIDAPIL